MDCIRVGATTPTTVAMISAWINLFLTFSLLHSCFVFSAGILLFVGITFKSETKFLIINVCDIKTSCYHNLVIVLVVAMYLCIIVYSLPFL